MTMTPIMFAAFALLIIIGVPIGWALGISALTAIILGGGGFQIALLASRLYNANNSFVLLAIPFFILAGNLMSMGGMSRRLVDFCKALIGWITGGLSMVATVACFFFSALSGNNAATTAAIGGMMIPELENNGYPRDLSSAVVAASGTTGQVVPPSSAMVVYASIANCSLSAMFLAGFTPGIMMSVTIMIVSYFICKRLHIAGVKWGGLKNLVITFFKSIWALLMPVIIIGGIYSGAMTATEAAVVACVYSLVVCLLIYREIKIKDLPKIFWKSAETTAVGMVVVTCAALFSWVLTVERVPEKLAAFILNVTDSRMIIIVLINVVLLIAGCFITPTSAIVILAPIFLPITRQLGIHDVAFGVIMVVNLAIGSITPPVGGNLFVAQSIAGINIESIIKRVTPYLLVLLADLLLMSIFPDILMFLPNVLGA